MSQESKKTTKLAAQNEALGLYLDSLLGGSVFEADLDTEEKSTESQSQQKSESNHNEKKTEKTLISQNITSKNIVSQSIASQSDDRINIEGGINPQKPLAEEKKTQHTELEVQHQQSNNEALSRDANLTEDNRLAAAENSPGLSTNSPELSTNSPELSTNSPELSTNSPELSMNSPELSMNSPELKIDSTASSTINIEQIDNRDNSVPDGKNQKLTTEIHQERTLKENLSENTEDISQDDNDLVDSGFSSSADQITTIADSGSLSVKYLKSLAAKENQPSQKTEEQQENPIAEKVQGVPEQLPLDTDKETEATVRTAAKNMTPSRAVLDSSSIPVNSIHVKDEQVKDPSEERINHKQVIDEQLQKERVKQNPVDSKRVSEASNDTHLNETPKNAVDVGDNHDIYRQKLLDRQKQIEERQAQRKLERKIEKKKKSSLISLTSQDKEGNEDQQVLIPRSQFLKTRGGHSSEKNKADNSSDAIVLKPGDKNRSKPMERIEKLFQEEPQIQSPSDTPNSPSAEPSVESIEEEQHAANTSDSLSARIQARFEKKIDNIVDKVKEGEAVRDKKSHPMRDRLAAVFANAEKKTSVTARNTADTLAQESKPDANLHRSVAEPEFKQAVSGEAVYGSNPVSSRSETANKSESQMQREEELSVSQASISAFSEFAKKNQHHEEENWALAPAAQDANDSLDEQKGVGNNAQLNSAHDVVELNRFQKEKYSSPDHFQSDMADMNSKHRQEFEAPAQESVAEKITQESKPQEGNSPEKRQQEAAHKEEKTNQVTDAPDLDLSLFLPKVPTMAEIEAIEQKERMLKAQSFEPTPGTEIKPHIQEQVSIQSGLEISTALVSPLSQRSKNPAPHWAEPSFQAIFFDVAGMKLAIPLLELSGIVEWGKDYITPMPGHEKWYLGLLQFRGKSVPIIDTLQQVFPPNQVKRIMKDRNDFGNIIMIDDGNWGLACEQIIGIRTIAADSVKWRTDQTKRRWLLGTVKDQMCALLDSKEFASMLKTGKDSLVKNA